MSIPFVHHQAAHCESGATANLLRFQGFTISEAMAFGIGGGLFFGYFPFIRLNYLPLITYRKGPGGIFKAATKRLGVQVKGRRFRDQDEGMAALDALLAQDIPVGAQTSVYWLPYLPPALRFHFNAHNVVVYGKERDAYWVSDPVMDEAVLCPAEDLRRARFAEGDLAPKGRLYYLASAPQHPDLRRAVLAGIREVCRNTCNPVPIIGVRGMRRLAKVIAGWPEKLGERKALQHLGHLIRMQEEIGTGGGGFRFMYAAFLQEATGILDHPPLHEFSRRMTEIGDRWREFALLGARACKGRKSAAEACPELAVRLRECADLEEALFRQLGQEVRRL